MMENKASSPLRSAIILLASLLLISLAFRATVGARGGLLALICVLLIVERMRVGDWQNLFPQDITLRIVGLSWLGIVSAWALLGPEPMESLRGVRSDVLAPILGFCAFYTLTRTRTELMRWSLILFVTQVVLTVLVMLDPFQPINPLHRPAYIDVGVLSAWLVLVAALLPIFWCAPRTMRAWARPVCAGMAISIAVAAFFSGNRIVWICFAAMLLAGSLMLHRINGMRWKRWLLAAAGFAMLGALAWASVHLRASSAAPNSPDSVAYVLDDPRSQLWKKAVQMISERPLSGYGYDLAAARHEFATRSYNPAWPSNYEHAHNTVLNYGLQIGLIGVLLIPVLFACLFAVFLYLPRSRPVTRLAACCGFALVTGFFLRNLMDDFFIRQSVLLFAAIAGMLIGVSKSRTNV